jgi:hypothetical protein
MHSRLVWTYFQNELFYLIIIEVQWTHNNAELQLRQWKRGREDAKGKGEQDGKESVWACIV